MRDEFSIAEAKNRLPALVHSVERGPHIKLTRRGKPVAILLSIQEYERLSRVRSGFWSALSTFRQKIRDEDIEITDRDFEAIRDRSTGRKVELRG